MAGEILVKGGLVVDGTGAEGQKADVAVRDGRVVAVAPDLGTGGRRFRQEEQIVHRYDLSPMPAGDA